MSNSEDTMDELIDRRQVLRDLIRSEGWKILKEVLEGQIEGRKAKELSMDLDDGKSVNELRMLRAERRTMGLLLALPEGLINSLDYDIDTEEETDGRDE